MANLNLMLNLNLLTGGMVVTRDFKSQTLSPSEGEALFSKTPIEEIKLELISSNEGAGASFDIGLEHRKKGAVLEFAKRPGSDGLSVRASGEFSVKLRKGADTMLKELGENLDLRVRAVTWKGGYYRGFSAPIEGGDFSAKSDGWELTFPRIEKFQVK